MGHAVEFERLFLDHVFLVKQGLKNLVVSSDAEVFGLWLISHSVLKRVDLGARIYCSTFLW
jgi:hypothetical protein